MGVSLHVVIAWLFDACFRSFCLVPVALISVGVTSTSDASLGCLSHKCFHVFLIFFFLQVLNAFHLYVSEKLSTASSSHSTLSTLRQQVQSSMDALLSPQHFGLISGPLAARDLAYSLARIYIGRIYVQIQAVPFGWCYFLIQFQLM